jgi:hypothetical protein
VSVRFSRRAKTTPPSTQDTTTLRIVQYTMRDASPMHARPRFVDSLEAQADGGHVEGEESQRVGHGHEIGPRDRAQVGCPTRL